MDLSAHRDLVAVEDLPHLGDAETGDVARVQVAGSAVNADEGFVAPAVKQRMAVQGGVVAELSSSGAKRRRTPTTSRR